VNSIIRPRARDDIIRQFRWYLLEQDAPEAAFRFLDAVEESVKQLMLTPDMGAPKRLRNPVLAGLRSWPVQEFEDIRIYSCYSARSSRWCASCTESATSIEFWKRSPMQMIRGIEQMEAIKK